MKRIILATAALFAVTVLSAQDLTILHMNDTHSHIDPQRSGEHVGKGGAIEQAAFIDSVRTADGKKNVLLVHAGDFGQGTSYFSELHGDIEIDVLNTLGFDVVCLGNHEFDNGTKELARRLKNLDAAVVCANYDFTNSPLNGLVKPYVVLKKGGKKIGVIGLLTDIRRVVDKGIAAEFSYQEPVEVVNHYAAYLKNDMDCDIVMCLSHLGFHEDKEVASMVRNVDVIVGGHSHTHIDEPEMIKDLDGKEVVIVQNWKWGLNVGVLKIDF